MSRIKAKNTKPELIVRSYLFKKGFRYRLHSDKLPGKPDIVLTKYKTIIFVHGCFWHGHKGCNRSNIPKTNTDYWNNKINKNIEKFNDNQAKLKALGWNVIIVWECETKSSLIIENKISNLKEI